MKLKIGIRQKGGTTEYPTFSMLVVMALILLSPFVSVYLCYLAFLICIYRMLCYNVKVFATDYCILLPATQIFRTESGVTFLIWLCLIAAVWFFLRGKIRANTSLVLLIVLLNYLITRMQMAIDEFVLCFGQIFILYVLLPQQDAESAERTAKAFCWSLIVTSIYALVFRNTSQLVSVRGQESFAIWGTSIMRFSGLGKDPNYFMTLLITGMAALCKLKETGNIQALWFWGQIVLLAAFGILTYSKTFFLMTILLVGMYTVWQFWSKKFFKGIAFAILGIGIGMYFLLSENSPFAVVLARFTSGSGLSNITTGRTDLYVRYWNVVTENIAHFLFGLGLKAPILGKGTHMLYLELIYYVGVVGLILVWCLFASLVRNLQKNNPKVKNQSLIAKYAVLAIVAIQYLSLQGMFQVLTYGVFFVAFLSIEILPKGDRAEIRHQRSQSAELGVKGN